MDNVLIPHKGYSRFRGILVGTNHDNFLKQDTTPNGVPYRRMQFGIKTSPENTVFVELFGFKNDKVYAYNKVEKKTLAIDWDKRDNVPDGYGLIGVTADDKENILVDYDAIEYISDNFNEGDSIFVNCENKYSEYNNKLQVKHQVRSIYHTSDPIDFEAEDFEEMNDFNQELTITDVIKDNDAEKLFVNAYIIEKQGKEKPPAIQPAVFTVSYNNDNKKMVNAMAKQKFGTTMKVTGFVHNRAVVTGGVVDDEWGDQPATITDIQREMEINKVDATTVETKKYTEEDFAKVMQQNETDNMFDDNGENDDGLDFLND